jgi:hypothetical protein
MLLLHEFYARKFLLPDKLSARVRAAMAACAAAPLLGPQADMAARLRQVYWCNTDQVTAAPLPWLFMPQEKERLAKKAAAAQGEEGEGGEVAAPKPGGKKGKGPQVGCCLLPARPSHP